MVLSQAFRQLSVLESSRILCHYMFEDSPVYACFLDASKAFDLVNHGRLFTKLLNRGFPVALVRLLISWYREQRMSVRWDTHVSSNFPTTNGVRQGGVLSPVLFTLYMDDLLVELSELGVGCYWEGLFAGAFVMLTILFYLLLPQLPCVSCFIVVSPLLPLIC